MKMMMCICLKRLYLSVQETVSGILIFSADGRKW